ncbi:sugar kinase [Saccharicrinis aurantiacus]|uniref:sugar kinase n=1 Tax=Saccharicrinis aurantiacus TaxID=1849719 RepID=UPI0009500B84|nr:sugar kinase [Saccharicrinis aurantiacus]
MSKIVTFGEIMGRICPENFQRFRQSMPGKLDLTFAGAEANVAASVAMLGGDVKFVTALPDNEMTEACLSVLKGIDVDTSGIKLTDHGRFGLYFVERGANQRPSRVMYDRDYSAVSMTPGEDYDWNTIFDGSEWLHTTGITPALSEMSATAAEIAVRTAKEKGLTVSCDLNFRKKLWQWQTGTSATDLAQKTMRAILPYVDVVIANEEDAHDVLGISAENTDIEGGKLDVDKYVDVAKEIIRQFPNVKKVAITLRESLSATHNNWGALLYDATEGKAHIAPMNNGEYAPYQIKNIIDRVGGGDSFGAGLVFALNTPDLAKSADAIRFAVAASCLCHSINGDFNYSSRSEVEALMGGSGSGRVVR